MAETLTITGLAGSIRVGSHSRGLLAALARLLPPGTDYAALDIGTLPHYDQDLDAGEGPTPVAAARARVQASDALLIVTPEFNHSIPGVLKNALDWLSRPAFRSSTTYKPVLCATVSPGPLGGVRAQAALRDVLASMLCHLPPAKELVVTQVGQKVVEDTITDAATLTHFEQALRAFLQTIRRP